MHASFNEGNTWGILPFRKEFPIFVVSLRVVLVTWWLSPSCFLSVISQQKSVQGKGLSKSVCSDPPSTSTVGLISKHDSLHRKM